MGRQALFRMRSAAASSSGLFISRAPASRVGTAMKNPGARRLAPGDECFSSWEDRLPGRPGYSSPPSAAMRL